MAPNPTSTPTSYAENNTSTSPKQLCQNTLPDQPMIGKTTTTTTDAPVVVLDLKRECDRQKTYVNWPLSFLKSDKLAAAGFYYLGKADLVCCTFCHVEIGRWEKGDDPMRDHQRWSPNCPYLKNQNVGNVPCSTEEAPSSTSTSLTQGHDTCGPNGIVVGPFSGSEAPSTSTSLTLGGDTCGQYGIVVRPFSRPENGLRTVPLSEEEHGIHKSAAPLHKDYSTKEARLRSYKYWPVSLKQKPNVLSDAGFYYTGKGDQTVCFHCGGGLKDWEDSDDPWVEHALWFSKCMFVYLVKGKAFIDQVCAEKQAKLMKKEAQELESPSEPLSDTLAVQEVEPSKPLVTAEPVSIETEESNSRKLDDARLCKICFTEELGVLFLPCGHIIACVHCAPALSVCAACRQPFTATVRAYLP